MASAVEFRPGTRPRPTRGPSSDARPAAGTGSRSRARGRSSGSRSRDRSRCGAASEPARSRSAVRTADLDTVPYLDRPFDEQDQAGHEVVHDRLETETDADPDGAPENCEAAEIEARRLKADHQAEQEQDVAEDVRQSVLLARIH